MAITKVSRNLLNTGVSDSSDATAITITSDEKVGLGVTAPENYTFGTPLAISAPSGANSGLTIVSATNSNGTIAMADGTSGIEAYRGFLQYSHISDAMFIGANGATVARFDAHGIKFGSDSAATNALDDYEEGLWTPTIASGGSVTSTSARYTKIGNTVRATARLSSFSFTNVDGTHLTIGGLPYSMHSDSNVGFAWGATGTQGKAVYFWSGSGGGSTLYSYWSGSNYDSVTHNEVPSGFNLIINLVYGHG